MKSLFLMLLILQFICLKIKAAPYNVKDAFCRDRLSNYKSNYDNAKIYNHCMVNADYLIREYERKRLEERIKWEKGAPERKRQAEEAAYRQRQRELEKQREQQEAIRRKELEEKRLDNFYEMMFDKFE